ncbi:hypothetical protein [Streptomyces sp. BK239]|uniref:hypothetical protein n=1 Tax=Streptomyces sp. BK239 TaxID=2512155 RepID=UPI00102B7853|nr:hypothetical protein [Streptomyces sp. BK239]RZU23949.1 hypothetical protein EV567_1687 [Streptomyces sp. BK239]
MNPLPTPHLLAALPGAAALLLSIGAVTPAEAGIPGDRLRRPASEGECKKTYENVPKTAGPGLP